MSRLVSTESETKESENKKFKTSIVWKNVVLITTIHILAAYGYYLLITSAKWKTILFAYTFTVLGALFGITAGAHRLWSHRSYKAKFSLRVVLMISNCIALQNDIYEWCRDHRVHHKYSETDADPHNSNRGFFFAHMGWLMCRKHPQVIEKGKKMDMSDVLADPIVQFQRRHYYLLVLLFWGLTPTVIPCILWGETVRNSFFICVMFRYVFSLHSTWLVNSAAHKWGNKPYDKNIDPRENVSVVYASYGEGYHNYHHTFPWDYSTSEFGWKYNFNFTTLLIDLFASMNLAFDRRTVSKDNLSQRIRRTGDGTWRRVNVIVHWALGIVMSTTVLWFSYLLQYVLFKFNFIAF